MKLIALGRLMMANVSKPIISVPRHAEDFLDDLATSLQIAPDRYEAAERSYKAIGAWLQRQESKLSIASPEIYIQGSFRLGTTIRPASDEEDYDLDLVCELDLSKATHTQKQVKTLLGDELRGYAKAHSMKEVQEHRRCWTLEYADGAQFHVDTVPAIPDGERQRLLLEAQHLSTSWSSSAIAITDREHHQYRRLSDDWPNSNPKGYANWFRSRMAATFEARRTVLAMEAKASVEAIPEYKVRTPLQHAIQILKRHRDLMFAKDGDHKPISIIISTLAAHAYQQEPTITGALYSIIANMDRFIEDRSGTSWIANPTDEAENFADRWQLFPKRKIAFDSWLQQVRSDFSAAAKATSRDEVVAALKPRFGTRLVEEANSLRSKPKAGLFQSSASTFRRFASLLNPSHREEPPWASVLDGEVRIERAVYQRHGFQPKEFSADSPPLPKRCSLRFEADTNVPKPYGVFWQIVNTGSAAENAKGLRGGFDEGIVSSGKLTKTESTLYTGKHSIECFIVKDGLLAARSGQFIVNIQ